MHSRHQQPVENFILYVENLWKTEYSEDSEILSFFILKVGVLNVQNDS